MLLVSEKPHCVVLFISNFAKNRVLRADFIKKTKNGMYRPLKYL